MTIGIDVDLRTDRLQLILDAIDAESDEYSGAFLTIYSGVRPATGGSDAGCDPLVEFVLPYPCGEVTDGVLTFDAISSVLAIDYGIATWARIEDTAENFIMDLSVTNEAGSGDVKIDDTEIFTGALISCTLATMTEGNA
jgi:hypothetical protein